MIPAAALLLALASPSVAQSHKAGSFVAAENTFELNGKPFVVKAAELHYPRIPRPYWEHRIKMCKALGMNTICLYVFWNIHEQQEGVYDFSDNNDVAEFCRLCQKNGMYVIVRPGPYVCAEWEMGGLPWWLLKKKDIRLREDDPYFLERVKRFEQKVGEQLADLTIQKGGPIIMVQVENEYGSYGENKTYVSAIRDIVRGSGFSDVALFQCDWSSNFTKNGLDDLIWTMNFGTGADVEREFRPLSGLRPSSPQMCSEFWSGWFDKWGARHETRPADDMVAGIDTMLNRGVSFSLYMTHGGTSFGHWAGANSPGFQPDVTSYDYDAPINEQGQATPKFFTLRETMLKYNGGKSLPSIPKSPMPFISIPEFEFSDYRQLGAGVDSVANSVSPLTFEDMDMGWGSMIYETHVSGVSGEATLTADVHDFAIVYVDGKYAGKIDRTRNEKSLSLSSLHDGSRLTMVVEGMGRINFGRAIKDFKGIIGDVSVSASANDCDVVITPRQWTCLSLPDSPEQAKAAFSQVARTSLRLTTRAGYYRATFNLKKVGDTFLSMEAFGKGQVYVNGHALGRFWSIGPQQTLFLPGCWLRKGKNEVIVLDVVGPKGLSLPTAFAQDHPELDKLNLEKSSKHNAPGDRPDLNSATPALQSSFASGNGWQTHSLASPAKGRYVAIECLAAHSDAKQMAVAEIYLCDADGNRLPRANWVARYADSENGNHTLDKAFDLQESTYWQSEASSAAPHLVVIDLGEAQTVSAIEYLPRMENGAPGSVSDFKLFVY